MNLRDAIAASPYQAAVREIGQVTYTVRPNTDNQDGSAGPDSYERTIAIGGVVQAPVTEFVDLEALIANTGGSAEADGWTPIGENGEPIDGDDPAFPSLDDPADDDECDVCGGSGWYMFQPQHGEAYPALCRCQHPLTSGPVPFQ